MIIIMSMYASLSSAKYREVLFFTDTFLGAVNVKVEFVNAVVVEQVGKKKAPWSSSMSSM